LAWLANMDENNGGEIVSWRRLNLEFHSWIHLIALEVNLNMEYDSFIHMNSTSQFVP